MNDKYAALKQAAETARGAHDRLSVMPPDDIFDISLHEGTQLDSDITDMNNFNDTANPAIILALLAERDADKARIADQREVMRQAAADIAYAIFNLTGADISRLSPGVVESTDPTDTALIAERNLRAAAGISLKIEGE